MRYLNLLLGSLKVFEIILITFDVELCERRLNITMIEVSCYFWKVLLFSLILHIACSLIVLHVFLLVTIDEHFLTIS